MLELENILTLRRIQREASERIEKLYMRYYRLSRGFYEPENLRYCEKGIALNKKRLKAVQLELKRREYIRTNSFSRLGY